MSKRRHPPRRRLFVDPASPTRRRASERRASTADSSATNSMTCSIAIGPLFVEPASQQSEHRHPPCRQLIVAPASDEQAPPPTRRRAGEGTAIRLAADSSSTQRASTTIRLTADSSLSQRASRAITTSCHRRRAAAATTILPPQPPPQLPPLLLLPPPSSPPSSLLSLGVVIIQIETLDPQEPRMLLHRGADVRSLCDVCDVTFQGRVVRAHGEETPHHHEAVAAAQTAQHTSRADSVSTVFSDLVSDT